MWHWLHSESRTHSQGHRRDPWRPATGAALWVHPALGRSGDPSATLPARPRAAHILPTEEGHAMHTRQTDLARLLMGTKVFVVPQFQRHYKWKQPQWLELFDDIVDQFDSDAVQSGNLVANEGHFLGSIVLHPTPGPAATLARYWVIDGQQRLTTLMVLISAFRDLRAERETSWDPGSYTYQYLQNQFHPEDSHKLRPGDNDRPDFISTVYDGNPSGQIGEAYRWFLRALRKLGLDSADQFQKFENALLLRLLVVEINTSEDDDINQIFHTINFAGMKLTAIDLIRNYSFMQFSQEDAVRLHDEVWRPIEISLGDESSVAKYLWAQLVRIDPKTTQRDLYRPYQNSIEVARQSTGTTAALVIADRLAKYRDEVHLFKAIDSPWDDSAELSLGIVRELRNLAEWGSQTHIPIALELLSLHKMGILSAESVQSGLRAVLSYLVRRGLAGIPTNNLNRILSAIPRAIRNSSDPVSSIISELSQSSRYWPTDRELLDRGVTAPVFLTLQDWQMEYILSNIADEEGNTFSGDHAFALRVMPDPMTPEWKAATINAGVDIEAAVTRANTIGNTWLSAEKKTHLSPVSAGSAGPAPSGTTSWTPSEIDARSADLLRLAARRWPRPTAPTSQTTDSHDFLPSRFDLDTILASIPGDSTVETSVVASLTGLEASLVSSTSSQLGYPVVGGRIRGLVGASVGDEEDLKSLTIADVVAAVESVGADSHRMNPRG